MGDMGDVHRTGHDQYRDLGEGRRRSTAALDALSPDGRARYGERMQRMAGSRPGDGKGLEPDAVAVGEHALYARRPPAFDTVGRDAHALARCRRCCRRAPGIADGRYLGL